MTLELQAVLLPPPLLVEAGDVVIAAGQTDSTVPLAQPFDPAHTFVLGGYHSTGGTSDLASGGGVGSIWATFTLVPPASLTVKRASTLGNSRFHYQVVRDR